MRNKKRPARVFERGLCAALALVLALSLTACGGEANEPLRAPGKMEAPTVSIETVYGTLAFPEELYDNLRHMEVENHFVPGMTNF